MKNLKDKLIFIIDKYMDVGFRVLAFVIACSIGVACVCSCTVKTKAISNADEFNEALITEMERFGDAYDVAMATHVLTPEVPAWAMAIEFYGLMNTYEYINFQYFDDTNNSNPSYSISEMVGQSGVYYNRFVNSSDPTYNSLRYCSVLPPSSLSGGTCVIAQDFTIDYSFTADQDFDYSGITLTVDQNAPTICYYRYPNRYKNLYYHYTVRTGATVQYSNVKSSNQLLQVGYGISTSSIPYHNNYSFGSTGSNMCGACSLFTLPSGSITREEPWNYYNDLIDDCHEKYGDTEEVNEWLPWHGQKWVPGHVGPVDPTEPARPNAVDLPSNLPVVPYVPGTPTEIPVEIDTNGSTEIYEVYSPTTNQITINGVAFIIGAAGAFGAAGAAGAAGGIYANGQITIGGEPFDIPSFDLPIDGFDVPISIPDSNTIQLGDLEFHFNPDGTITIGDVTFNLPLGEPETIEAGAETYLIEYELPTFETLYVPAETLPEFSLSEFSDGISLIWDSTYDFLVHTGALPVVYIVFGISVVGFVIWKIGG